MGNDLCQMGFAAGPLTRYGTVGGHALQAATLPLSLGTTRHTTRHEGKKWGDIMC